MQYHASVRFPFRKTEEQDPAAEQQTEIDCPHCNDVWGSPGGSGFRVPPSPPKRKRSTGNYPAFRYEKRKMKIAVSTYTNQFTSRNLPRSTLISV